MSVIDPKRILELARHRQCTKQTFYSKDAANQSAHQATQYYGKKLTAYQCRDCHNWHTTSVSKRDQRDKFPDTRRNGGLKRKKINKTEI